MLSLPAAQAEGSEIVREIVGSEPEGTVFVCTKQPVHKQVPNQELVTGDVPQQDRPPLIIRAAASGERDKRTVAASGVKPPVQHLRHVSKPGSARSPDEVLLPQSIKVLLLRGFQVPASQRFVGI